MSLPPGARLGPCEITAKLGFHAADYDRALVVVDSPVVGLVAILPVGMEHIPSVRLTPEVGAELRKGDELGYFLFGGSDIVLLFQNRGVRLDAKVGQKYLQGRAPRRRRSDGPVKSAATRRLRKELDGVNGPVNRP